MIREPHNCKKLQQNIVERIQAEIKENNYKPRLVVLQVGNREDSTRYVNNKQKIGKLCGIDVVVKKLDEDITQDMLCAYIQKENNSPIVHGIIVQLPLPKHINEEFVINYISSDKDVDGLNRFNKGMLYIGHDCFIPCTPKAVMTILSDMNVKLSGKHVVVIGRSDLVGKPLTLLLERNNATVTLCHSKTKDLYKHTQKADIVISAVGKRNLVTSSMIAENAIVIDVGINFDEQGKLCGDVNTNDAFQIRCGKYTSVPGGVGLITTAMLMENTLLAYKGTRK